MQGWADREEFTGRWERDRLYLGNYVYRVSRQGDDLLLRDDRDTRHQFVLYRTW